MQDGRSKYRFGLGACWVALLGTTVFLLFYPITIGLVRLFLVVSIPLLCLGASGLLWRRKRLRLLPIAALAAMLLLLVAPGRTPDRDRLRDRYVKCLRDYEGVRYLWGGESGGGIDCSGLVRRGLVRASLSEGFRTINPGLLRYGLDIWWHDCSARALKDQYRDWTRHVLATPSINQLQPDQLAAGDMAVTSDGVHVLAYLGGGEWIEADPGLGKVIRARAPVDGNPWFKTPVHVLRWRELEAAADR